MVKTENIASLTRNDTDNGSSIQKWTQEKQKLIDKITNLQTENQRLVLQLKAQESELSVKMKEKENEEKQLSEKIVSLSENVNVLQSDLLKIQNEMSIQESKNKKMISDLTQENKKMHARSNQLQKGLVQPIANTSKNDESADNLDDVYEVEQLVNHKKKKSGIYYLVRWKNYSPSDDTWVKETDLQCLELLNEYKRNVNLK